MANELITKFEMQLVEQEDKWAPQLPPNIDPTKFKASAMTAVMKTPDLLQADRASLLMACMQSARSGILPDGKEGAIVAFSDWKTKKKMAQWMPMTPGIIRRLRELGDLTSISAYVVYETDTFSIELGDDPKIVHKVDPKGSKDASKIIGAYAIFRHGDHVIHREYMTREEIDETRGVSRAKDGPAWKNWYGEMARKTVIRRGSKAVPLSAEGRAIIETDDQWTDFSGVGRSIDKVEDNPLNDNVIDAVAEDVVDQTPEHNDDGEIVDITSNNGEVEEVEEAKPKDDLAAKIIAAIEKAKTPDALEAWATKNKEKIAALPAPSKGKVTSAYKSKLKELRAA